MRKILFFTVAMLFCFAGKSFAAPFMLPQNTPIVMSLGILEQVDIGYTTNTNGDKVFDNSITVPGLNGGNAQGNWGVFRISTIQATTVAPGYDHTNVFGTTGNTVFSNNGNGQITGVFYGLDLTSAHTATGGYLDLYWHDKGAGPDLKTDGSLGPNQTTVEDFTTANNGVFLGRLKFASGIIAGDNTTTLYTPTDLTGSLPYPGSPATASAYTYANVDPTDQGLWSDYLNTDYFTKRADGSALPGARDIYLKDSFYTNSLWNGSPGSNTVGLAGNDPAEGFTATPEPGTIFLLGFGLLGVGLITIRKKNAA